ncbi:hypothetical protein FJTKL_14368 [Diaporthe vaccinii]|uniref:Uncharacterized protein n=1 Tax=Diaporthe vaccinii TaxID=105482 RepID=A0ABR4E7L7_9PEZI
MANAHQNPGNSSEEEKESSIEAKEQLAYELDRNEDTEGAITTYKEIIEMKTREYGEDSLQVAKTLQELGETAAQTLVKVSTTEASSSKASPAAVPSTEPTSDSGSAQNQVLPADKEGTSEDREGTSEDKEGTSADVSGPVAPPTSKKQRKNKKRNVRRRAKKKSGENNQSGPSQSQAGPPDGPSRSEDAERVEEKKGSQPLSNDTSHTPEAVEPVEPAIEPVEPPVEPVEPPVEPVEPPVEPVEPA